MGRIWLSSDWHLGHGNIAGPKISQWKDGGWRNFDSIKDMDDTIIDAVNKYVAEDDVLWFLGDMVFGGHVKTTDYRRRIACKNIHIIRGNHDHHIDKYEDLFSSIQDYAEITIRGNNGIKHQAILLHYALRVWKGSHKGYLHFYGHSHASLEHTPNGKSKDVGVDSAFLDFGEWRPYCEEELVDMMDERKINFPDHHSAHTNVN